MKVAKFAVALVALSIAGTAFGGIHTGTIPAWPLWGQNYSIDTWYVELDLGAGLTLEPEGMTFHDGSLYITGDSDETFGWLAKYTPGPTGDLSTPTPMQYGQSSFGHWGPEGITVNTSGSGFGSWTTGGPKFATVDSEYEPAGPSFAVIDFSSAPGVITDEQMLGNPDDIAYLPDTGVFAVISDPDTILFYSKDDLSPALAPIDMTLDGLDEVKGLARLSPAFASMLLGTEVTEETLLIAAKESNRLAVYQLDGTLLGGIQMFPEADDLDPPFPGSEIEALGIDEANNLIYVADEEAKAVHVITVPEPAGLLLIGLATLVLRRR